MELRIMSPPLLRDFFTFSRLHVESGDVDPLYPVLRHLIKDEEPEAQVWRTLVYVAFYNLPSALLWQERIGDTHFAGQWNATDAYLPTGVERRSLRGGVNMLRHLQDLARLARLHGGFRNWLTWNFTGDSGADWAQLQRNVAEAWGNGRWAAYKTAEVCQKVLGFPVEPADMGNAGSTGPRKGLELLFGPSQSVGELDAWGGWLHSQLAGNEGVNLDLAEVETCLCDFHSMWHGHYYVGHDIDQLQADTIKAFGNGMKDVELEVAIWEARAATLRPEYLGELNGWAGVDKERGAAYRDSGRILARHE